MVRAREVRNTFVFFVFSILTNNYFVLIISIVQCAVLIAFLRYNLPPARIFMGDVGSIPLGYFIGWLLLSIAAEGYYVVALLLPVYYLTDSTYTIIKRLFEIIR